MILSDYLVFVRDCKPWREAGLPEEVTALSITHKVIEKYLVEDVERGKIFYRFLEKGFIGNLLLCEGEWASCLWMTTPQTQKPPHLPLQFHKLKVYWLIHGHTKAKFRNRGLFKFVFIPLIDKAYSADENAIIVADCKRETTASRRTFKQLGFTENGLVYSLRVPKTQLVFGFWDKKRSHPPLPLNMQGVL